MFTGSIIPNLSQLQETFTISGPKYDLAIAEIAIFALALVIAVPIRVTQERKYWSWNHSISYNVFFLVLLGWLRNYIALMCELRIVGNALYLVGMGNKEESLFITSSVLMGIGLSPIVFEMSQVVARWYVFLSFPLLTMLQSSRANIHPGESSAFPSRYNTALACCRIPIAVAVAFMVIGGAEVNNHPSSAGSFYKAGSVIFALTVFALRLFTLFLAVTMPVAAVGRNGRIAL